MITGLALFKSGPVEKLQTMAYFVALDGGGTKTQCWVGDDRNVLGRASAGTVKLMAVDEATATSRLQQLVRETLAQAGAEPNQVAGTCFGLAGSSSDSVRIWAENTLRSVVTGPVEITLDTVTALDADFHGGPGVLVISGTGSNILGRCSDGRTLNAGGWGPMLGDEGSGYWIGLEAIRASLRAQDRGVTTCLLQEIEAFWSLADQGELVAYANRRERVAFSELTHIVAQCAERGDALALSVLDRAGQDLAEQVKLVASKMHQAGCSSGDALQVAFTGSVLEKIARVRKSMEESLTASLPGVIVAQRAAQPLEGALWRARNLAKAG